MNNEILAALEEARRAIGDHYAPNDCYATGPMTGDAIRDLVQCPACSAIAMYDDLKAKLAAPAQPVAPSDALAQPFALYRAVNDLMAHIGMHGEIDSRHELTSKVMDELHNLDGGTVAQRVEDLVEKIHMPTNQATRLAVDEFIMCTEIKAETTPPQSSWQTDLSAALTDCRMDMDGTHCDKPGCVMVNCSAFASQPPAPQATTELLSDTLSTVLWLHRRLPRTYGMPSFVEKTIKALAAQTGVEVGEYLQGDHAAPQASQDAGALPKWIDDAKGKDPFTDDLIAEIIRLSNFAATMPSTAPSGWISVDDRLPEDETPVIILLDGVPHIGELRWETPSHEETFKAFRYWDCPHDDGQGWEWHQVTRWMPLPDAPSGDDV